MSENERARYYGYTRKEWIALTIEEQVTAMWRSRSEPEQPNAKVDEN